SFSTRWFTRCVLLLLFVVERKKKNGIVKTKTKTTREVRCSLLLLCSDNYTRLPGCFPGSSGLRQRGRRRIDGQHRLWRPRLDQGPSPRCLGSGDCIEQAERYEVSTRTTTTNLCQTTNNTRMRDERLPKIALLGELQGGARYLGGQE
ncbi:unnamed protein product, partial [Pylaiella littoralis]